VGHGLAHIDHNTAGERYIMDFDAWLAEASLPEETVPLCLNGPLVRKYEEVKARIEARQQVEPQTDDLRLGSPDTTVDAEQPELDRLTEQIQAKTRLFILRALPRDDFQELFAAHPPRKDSSTGRNDPRDSGGANMKTFLPAITKASIVDPALSDEQWSQLLRKLTDGQIEKLGLVGWSLNREDREIPFSLSGSPSPRSSADA
jgi:hypothetical protein